MVYLDYSATTPVDDEVLNTFCKVNKDFIGNANSIHKLGFESKRLMEQATNQVANLLKVKNEEVIFTSGSTEANNLAVLGTIDYYKNRGKQIITTSLEHSSVKDTLSYLKDSYDIKTVSLLEDGTIDLNSLEELLKTDTTLVTICYVNSETGILQPIKQIIEIVKRYPRTILHVDATQAVGKIPVCLDNIDLFSFSAHKFYGLKGIGCLIKKENINLTPIIHGGKSQTIYRSGTPALALIVSMAKALRIAIEKLPNNLKKVEENNNLLLNELKKLPYVIINSNEKSIPHIVNISILNVKPETMIHALEKYDIYISTQTACSTTLEPSSVLLSLNKSMEIAKSSLRISISHLTTKDEIMFFIKKLKECYNALEFEKR